MESTLCTVERPNGSGRVATWSLSLAAVVGLFCMAPTAPNLQIDVAASLSRAIIGPDLAEEQVARFCETRVPKLTEPTSIDDWKRDSSRMREDVLNKVVFRGPDARKWRDAKCKVVWLDTIHGGPGYHIRKLRYEAVPGFWIPALLYEPDNLTGMTPAHLLVNGHDPLGKATPYKQIRAINLAKRGMIAINVEWIGMGQLSGMSHYALNQIDLCGSSGESVFYLAMRRGLDVLWNHKNTNRQRISVSGLSGGGWQTIFLSSLDERVALSNPVAGYSSFLTRARVTRDLGDSEQTPNDLATVADYIHLTAMRAPRPTLLTFNDQDNCCFRPDTGMPPLVNGASPLYRLFGVPDRLQTHINYDPGTHNYERDNREAFYKFVGDMWFAGDPKYRNKEIPSDDEVKTPDQLKVELPSSNLSLHDLGLQALDRVKHSGKQFPEQPTAAQVVEMRKTLAEIVKRPKWEAAETVIDRKPMGDVEVITMKLQFGQEWTVPAVEFRKTGATDTVILVADAGRAATALRAQVLLGSGRSVLCMDPFFFGESKMKFGPGHLYDLLMAAVGERALGVQAEQIAATARLLKHRSGARTVSVESIGPRMSLIVSVAAALEPVAIDKIFMTDRLTSLASVIEDNKTVDQSPELFCFGLLERFDMPQLIGMRKQ